MSERCSTNAFLIKEYLGQHHKNWVRSGDNELFPGAERPTEKEKYYKHTFPFEVAAILDMRTAAMLFFIQRKVQKDIKYDKSEKGRLKSLSDLCKILLPQVENSPPKLQQIYVTAWPLKTSKSTCSWKEAAHSIWEKDTYQRTKSRTGKGSEILQNSKWNFSCCSTLPEPSNHQSGRLKKLYYNMAWI